MKVLLVDPDSNKLDSSNSGFNKSSQVDFKLAVLSGTNAKELAENLLATYLNSGMKYDCVLINAEGNYCQLGRQDASGIDLLFWLRLWHKYLGPVLMFGFQSVDQILTSNPHYLFVTAPFNGYARLPFDAKYLMNRVARMSKVIATDNIQEQYEPFLRPSMDLKKIRHEMANWWGRKQLWDVYNFFILHKQDFSDPNEVLEKVDRVNFLVAYFLSDKKEKLKEFHSLALSKQEEKHIELTDLEKNEPDEKLLVDLASEEVNEALANLKEFTKVNSNISAKHISKEYLEEYKCKLKSFEEAVTKKESQLENQKAEFDEFKSSIQHLRSYASDLYRIVSETLDTKNPRKIRDHVKSKKILLVDDEAHKGWSDVYNELIFDGQDNLVCVSKEEELDFSKENTVLAEGQEFLPDLVLLDLRLTREDYDLARDFKNLSGARILSQFKDTFPGIPVIVTTASNKVWSYKELSKLGADAFWMKEGVDNEFSVEETVNNYNDLIHFVEVLLGEEFQLYKQQALKFNELFKTTRTFWWENWDWNYEYYKDTGNGICNIIPRYTVANRDTVNSIIFDSLSLLREVLKIQNFDQGYNTFGSSKWSMYARVGQHLGYILEVIHDFKGIRDLVEKAKKKKPPQIKDKDFFKETGYDSKYTIASRRMDDDYNNKKGYRGRDLWTLRNNYAHFSLADTITLDNLAEFIEKTYKYVSIPPKTQNMICHLEPLDKREVINKKYTP